MKIQIEQYAADGSLKVSLPGIPDHSHTGGGSGGQLNASNIFNAGAVPIAFGGTGQTTAAAAFAALSPQTTKGDLIGHTSTAPARIPVGSDRQLLIADSAETSGLRWASAFQTAEVRDEKSSGTAGGSSASGSWQTRELNTETDPNGLVTIASNQFTPVVGTYLIVVESAFISSSTSGTGRLRLRNVTAGTTAATSINYRMLADTGVTMTLSTLISANGTDAYAVQYYVTQGRATNGLGLNMSITGEPEIYTRVHLVRLLA